MIGTAPQQTAPAEARWAGADAGALPWVANIGTLFQEFPASERPRRAADAGFSRIESWWPFATTAPSPAQVEAFIRSVEDAGVRLVALNLYGGPPGNRGVLSHADEVAGFCRSAHVASEVAVALGTRLFNAPFGDRTPGVDPFEQRAIGIASLCEAVDALPPGSRVLLEPLSAPAGGPATPFLRTVGHALDIVDAVERTGRGDAAGILFDVYHLTQNGEDLVTAADRAAGRIAHVQLADAPGRAEPGTGGIDFATVLRALDRSGYAGEVALEFFPADGDTRRALRASLPLLDGRTR
jgi:hydroxypyruvate isomerase